MVALVGIIGQAVVLKPVNERIVVHIHAEEEFGRINCIAQEGFGVVRPAVLVLIEIGDKVVVLVEAGKDFDIPARGTARNPDPRS